MSEYKNELIDPKIYWNDKLLDCDGYNFTKSTERVPVYYTGKPTQSVPNRSAVWILHLHNIDVSTLDFSGDCNLHIYARNEYGKLARCSWHNCKNLLELGSNYKDALMSNLCFYWHPVDEQITIISEPEETP